MPVNVKLARTKAKLQKFGYYTFVVLRRIKHNIWVSFHNTKVRIVTGITGQDINEEVRFCGRCGKNVKGRASQFNNTVLCSSCMNKIVNVRTSVSKKKVTT